MIRLRERRDTRIPQDQTGSKSKNCVSPTIALLLLVCVSFSSLDSSLRRNRKDDGFLSRNDAEMSALPLSTSSSENVNTVREQFHFATEKLEESLRKEYGQYYPQIFRSNYSAFFEMGEVSKERLVRRLTRKLAESLVLEKKETTFTWVTTGHSSAAGHGNLFNQSYTHTMEQMVSQVFLAVGLTFAGKNYAMGSGMCSAPEQALCMESLYGPGTDNMDVLSWDYDITDGVNTCLTALWGARGAGHPSQPTLVMLDNSMERWPLVRGLERKGIGVINALEMAEAYKGVPDYEKGENQTDLPKSLQHFVCNGTPESGLCNHKKWDTSICEKFGGQVRWHNGWKYHHLRGVILGHFMISMLKESVDHLLSLLDVSNPESVLDIVKSQDEKDREMWINSEMALPECKLDKKRGGKDLMTKMWPSLHKGNSMCSSALFPSDARLSGIVTGTPGTFGGKYDRGINEKNAVDRAQNTAEKNISMAILYCGSPYMWNHECYKEFGQKDSQDAFFVSGVKDDKVWHTKTVPNDREYRAFAKGTVASENYIMICVKDCNIGKCKELFKNMIIFVDNKKVTKLEPFGACHFLYASEGEETWVSKEDKPGQYEIAIRTSQADKIVRVQSFVIIPLHKKNT
mmetsp:Transcript_7821/g.16279  ORF Transcript_7821/g.16279 Transcript_7821/m.16279 type:complete len:629 (+) Transcript_7821:194-2080(+)